MVIKQRVTTSMTTVPDREKTTYQMDGQDVELVADGKVEDALLDRMYMKHFSMRGGDDLYRVVRDDDGSFEKARRLLFAGAASVEYDLGTGMPWTMTMKRDGEQAGNVVLTCDGGEQTLEIPPGLKSADGVATLVTTPRYAPDVTQTLRFLVWPDDHTVFPYTEEVQVTEHLQGPTA